MTTILQRAGEALYGARWQTDLARALNVNDRTVRRWASGQTPLPDGVASDLLALCDRQASRLLDVRERLRVVLGASPPT